MPEIEAAWGSQNDSHQLNASYNLRDSTRGNLNCAFNAEENTGNIPREGILILPGDVRIVSQKWLAHQAPPPEFTTSGGKLINIEDTLESNMKDINVMYCWFVDGKYFYSQLGEKWLTNYYGGRMLEHDDLLKFFCVENVPTFSLIKDGDISRKVIANTGVMPFGFLSSNGMLRDSNLCVIRSSTIGGRSYADRETLHNSIAFCGRGPTRGFKDSTRCISGSRFYLDGTIPFIVLQ